MFRNVLGTVVPHHIIMALFHLPGGQVPVGNIFDIGFLINDLGCLNYHSV